MKRTYLLGVLLVLVLFQCANPTTEQRSLLLIAHRGGVVDETHAENSISALEEAIRRGYTHVEVDARITSDGHVVCFHNDDLMEEAGLEGRISELPLDSVTQIVLTRSKEKIPTFEEYVARCAGRIGIMVDLKGCPDPFIAQYANEILTALSKFDLLSESLILINKTPKNNQEKIVPYFMGKAKVSWRAPLSVTQEASAQDADFAHKYYIFNHGADFDGTSVGAYQALGLQVIVSINTGHYRRQDPQAAGEAHIDAMLEYGVDGLQIDAVYDSLLITRD